MSELHLQNELRNFVSSSSAAVDVVASVLGLVDPFRVTSVASNVTDRQLGLATNRETDVVVDLQNLQDDSIRLRLLIEVKICAPFQPRQQEDYATRARTVAERGDCNRCLTVLIAPDSYPRSLFDVQVTFGALSTSLASRVENCKHARSLMDAVEAATAIAAAGYQPLVSLTRQQQFAFYRAFIAEHAPGVVMKPSKAAKQSLDAFFDSPTQWGYIKHRLESGVVCIERMQNGEPKEDLAKAITEAGLTYSMVGREGRTIQIYAAGNPRPLDLQRSFAEQIDVLQYALDRVIQLCNFQNRLSGEFRPIARS